MEVKQSSRQVINHHEGTSYFLLVFSPGVMPQISVDISDLHCLVTEGVR